MAQCAFADENGFIKISAQPVDECTAHILVSPTEYSLAVQTIEITPTEIGLAFSVPFGWIITLWYIAYKVRTAKTVINKI